MLCLSTMLIKLIEDEEVGTWVRFEIHPKKNLREER